MTTVQSSSNKKDTAMKALAIFLGESSGNFPDDNNLNSVFSDRFSHWTDSGFRQESEVVVMTERIYCFIYYIKHFPYIVAAYYFYPAGSLGGTSVTTCLCKNARRFKECYFTFATHGDSKWIL